MGSVYSRRRPREAPPGGRFRLVSFDDVTDPFGLRPWPAPRAGIRRRGRGLAPFLAEDCILTGAPHLLAPAGTVRNRDQALAGAATAHDVVSGQRFEVRRTTCEGNRVVVEAEWTATLLMDLPHWDAGEVIRARIASLLEVRDGRVISQDSYDCYFTPA